MKILTTCSNCHHGIFAGDNCSFCGKISIKELSDTDIKLAGRGSTLRFKVPSISKRLESHKPSHKAFKDEPEAVKTKVYTKSDGYCKTCQSLWSIHDLPHHECKTFKVVNGERIYS